MKFIAIHLAMAWIVLNAMPPSVRGGSLRGGLGDELLMSGRRMEEDATQTATTTSLLPDDTSENLTLTEKCPTVGKTQIWLGSHKVTTNIDHAKLWVISTNRDHHKALKEAGVDWKHVDEAFMPYDFGSIDKKCLKFFSIGGAKVDNPSTLNALINNGPDLRLEFDHPKLVTKMNLNKILQFKSDLDAAIKKMNDNFAVLDPEDTTRTILKYKLLTHTDWYRRGHGWSEFNGNGLVSGLLDYLELTKPKPEVDWVGWDKSVPKAFFDGSNTYTTMNEMQAEVYNTKTCEESAEEVWVGYHPVKSMEQDVWIDHAKIWVIKSVSEPSDLSRWNELSPDKIPGGFKGDPNCAKFYTMSSGVDPDEIHGQLNLGADIAEPFLGAVLAFRGFNGDLSKTIDDGNLNIEKNFALTSLKRTTAFPTEFNGWGIDWNQFNENGYISGLLNYLMFLKGETPVKGQEFKPHGGLLDGWVKDIPIKFFQKTYSTDEELKEVIFGDHPRTFVSESAAADPQVLTGGEEVVEEVSIDPLLAAEEDNLFRAKQL